MVAMICSTAPRVFSPFGERSEREFIHRFPPFAGRSEHEELLSGKRDWTDLGKRGLKRRAISSQVLVTSAKRRSSLILHDPATKSEGWLDGINNLLYCSSHILPVWGAKRAICRAKQAHSAIKWRRDWTDLGDGPAGLIAERLLSSDVADYVSFRAVCRAWRLCTTDPRKHNILDRRFHPRQWIMMKEPGATLPYRPRFMNVSSGNFRSVDLPEIHDHDIFPTTEGLLVLLYRTSYMVRLLNPLTRQRTNLPQATTLLSQNELPRHTSIIRDLLKVTGTGLADTFTIAVYFEGIKTLAVVRPGDACWTVVDRGIFLCPALSFAGRFYGATANAIMVVTISIDHPPQLAMAAKLTRPLSRVMMDTVHLVDNDGELMLVDRQRVSNALIHYSSANDCRKYNVYRVDLDAGRMVLVNGLGGRAVFVGIERALSISPSVFPSISADAIYLGFDPELIGRLDDSPILLIDGTTERREIDKSGCGPWGIDDYISWSVTG